MSARGDKNVKMSSYAEGFQFNLLGVMNTIKDNGIYKISAKIDDLEFTIEAVDWTQTTQRNFRFAQADI